MSTVTTRVHDLAEPICTAAGVELVDVELEGGILRVTIDRNGGVDVDVISSVTRQISLRLDDADPVPGRYVLEVSSPGLERKLRTPEHFRRAVGADVAVRTVAGTPGDRRAKGVLVSADDEGITVRLTEGADEPTERALTYDEIERARTVFVLAAKPKPGGGGRPTTTTTSKKATR